MRQFINGIIIGSFLGGILGLITNNSKKEDLMSEKKALKITARATRFKK